MNSPAVVAPPAAHPAHAAPTGIAWSAWSPATFAAAKKSRRVLLVNVATAWCHWCHVMDDKTFGDTRVTDLLARRFTCIRVDADARPDLAERYADWGWPATAFLTPDAEAVLELRGFQAPAAFLGILEDLVARQDSGKLKGRVPPPIPKPVSGDLALLRDKVQGRLDAYFDDDLGGWGRSQKYPFPGPVEHAFLRAPIDPAWSHRATQTLDGTRKLLDPVWGGVFQYSVQDRWDEPHFEKIAVIQAGALDNFAHAFQITGKPRYLAAAKSIEGYLQRFLRDPTGPFGTSQDADVQTMGVDGHDYYALGEAARLRVGIPGTDTNVYADWNGLLVSALLRLYRANLATSTLTMASQAVEALLTTHRTQRGAFTHAAGQSAVLHLRDNAAMGRALLALHEATGDERHLRAATDVARFMLRELQADAGGFYAHTADPAAAGAFAQRRLPLEENGLAVRFLVELSWRSDEGDAFALELRQAGERALRALGQDRLLEAEGRIIGQYLLGIEWLLLAPVKIVIQGESSDPRAVRLHQAALRALARPGLVRWAAPGEFPIGPKPAAYLCHEDRCSQPKSDARRLKADLQDFLAA